MKPDWQDAPEWANWLAMDDDNWWFWYEDKPKKDIGYWYIKPIKRSKRSGKDVDYWEETLQKRPDDEKA